MKSGWVPRTKGEWILLIVLLTILAVVVLGVAAVIATEIWIVAHVVHSLFSFVGHWL